MHRVANAVVSAGLAAIALLVTWPPPDACRPGGHLVFRRLKKKAEENVRTPRLKKWCRILSDREISEEIIQACREGNRDAFRLLYEHYKDKVYSIALYFFHGDAAEAGDTTQQVFLKLMTTIGQFRADSAFSTWLYRLVVNTCTDGARKSKSSMPVLDGSVAEAAGPTRPQEAHLTRLETANSVQAAVSSLPPKFRIAILLRYFEDLSYEEMAKVLNCSVGTVASRLSRGHRILAGKLQARRRWLVTEHSDVR